MKLSHHIFDWKNRFFRPIAFKKYEAAMNFWQQPATKKREIDFENCRQIVRTAYEASPFYREYYDSHGFHPDLLHTPNDWSLVPSITKDHIRMHVKQMVLNNLQASSLPITTTGGSTGEPLKLYKSPSVYVQILGWRALSFYGIHPAAPAGVVHRRVPQGLQQRVLDYITWWPTARVYLRAASISKKEIFNFLQKIQSHHIQWIVGYCGALEDIADFVIEEKLHHLVTSLRVVWSTSSPLTPTVRHKFEQAFRCPVMNQYGCCEMGNIAFQLPGADNMVVNSDWVHVDLEDDYGNIIEDTKQGGNILITDFSSPACPLIKYRVGDRGQFAVTMKDSPDGMPRLSFIQGRTSDRILFPEGGHLDGAYLTTICDNYTDIIDKYQIYQKEDYSITVYLMLKNNDMKHKKVIENIYKSLKNELPSHAEMDIKIVDSLPHDFGKRRFIVSELTTNQKLS